MMHLLAQAETFVLVSIFKPILFAIFLGLWGAAVGRIDKDLEYFYLPRRKWNLINMLTGVVAFGTWLLLPSFWIGMPVAIVVAGGELIGYVKFRNSKVAENKRWVFDPKGWLAAKRDAASRAAAQERANIAFTTKVGVRIEVPAGNDPSAEAHAKLEEIFGFAFPRGAQRIDINVGAKTATTAITVDGFTYPQPEMDPKSALQVVDYLKSTAKLDVEDRRKKQVGELYLEEGDAKNSHLLRLITIGSTQDITATLMIDPNKSVAMRLQDLGLLPAQLKALEPVLADAKGAVIVTCPSGHGMTTTLYACINQHDPYTQSIMTLEEEVPYEVEGVTHTRIAPGAEPAKIAESVNTLVRRDPQVVMVHKVADVPTAKAVAGAAGEVRFYIGMKQEDTFGALKTWIKATGGGKQGADGLAAIVACRLVRKLCTTCRAPFTPDPEVLKKMNLPPDKVKQLYKPSGKIVAKNAEETCPDCQGMAYRGRTGVFEVMVLDDAARGLIAQGQLEPLRAHLRKGRMLWLQEAALTKVVEGVTAIAEVSRAMGKEEKPAGKAPAKAEAE